jgi:hypothetical protein
MALVVAITAVVALLVVLWIALGREQGPSAIDTAVSYALARARGDWSTVYDLSAKELRGGRDRGGFVAAHRDGDARRADDATRAGGRHPHAAVEQSTVTLDAAVVVVHVDEPDVALRCDCERRDSRWVVVGVAPA